MADPDVVADDNGVLAPPVEETLVALGVGPVIVGAVGEMMQGRALDGMVGRVDAHMRGDVGELADARRPGDAVLHDVGIIVEERLLHHAALADFGVAPEGASRSSRRSDG